MPEYLSPGVYVEEIDAGPKPIEGVSTSTTGAVGVTTRGPSSGKPKLVTSFADFTRTFGGFMKEPDSATVNKWAGNDTEGGRWWHFPMAVKGFFDNGGKRLYVKRVFSAAATSSSATLGIGLTAAVTADAAEGGQTAKLAHLIGVANNTQLTFFNGDDGSQIAQLTVTAYSGSQVTLNNPLPAGGLKAKRGDFAQIHPRSNAPVPANETTLIFSARDKGAWGNALDVLVSPMTGATLNLLPDPNNGGNAAVTTVVSVTENAGDWFVEFDDVTDFADGDRVVIMNKEYTLSNFDNNVTFQITPDKPAAENWIPGTQIRRLRKANIANAGPTISAWGGGRVYTGALVTLDNGSGKEVFTVNSTNGDTLTLSGNLTLPYFEGHKLRVIEASVAVRYLVNGSVEDDELFSNLRLVEDGTLSNLANHINENSKLVTVQTGAGYATNSLTSFPTATNGGIQTFSGGLDNLDQLTVDDFVGVDGGSGNRTGIIALEDIDEVSICAAPGIWSGTVQGSLIQHCELLKDRFAIIDPQDDLDIEGIQGFREPLDTRYAALYYPWIIVRDPLAKKDVAVAPSLHMAGIYARTDNDRGVHKAPANEVIRGINGIAQDIVTREQDILNPLAINCLRFFSGRGNRVWGARVVTSDSAWKYINVRRLFIFVEESIEQGTQWVVFEPNDEPLWARLRQSIGNFLNTVWRSGALQGSKPDEAYFVICDRTTMTQDDIDNGRLICQVGIAPVKPAEFVIIRIQQKTLTLDQ